MFKPGDKVRLKVGEAHYLMEPGEVCTVEKGNHDYFGHPCIQLVGKDHPIRASRFELTHAAAEGAIIGAPLTKDIARVGMVVHVAAGDDHRRLAPLRRKALTIQKVNNATITLNEVVGGFFFKRFVVGAQPALEGDKLVCIEGHRPSGLRKGEIVTVRKVGEAVYYLQEYPGNGYAKRRFEPAPAEAVERPIKEGDMVYVVDKVEQLPGKRCQWAGPMDRYLGNGVAYRVLKVGNNICLEQEDNNWYYLPECLSHTPGKKAAPVPPQPKAPEIQRGDMVYVTKKVEKENGVSQKWDKKMERLLLNGKAYKVSYTTREYVVINAAGREVAYLRGCVSPRLPEGFVPPPPAPVEDIRTELNQRKKEEGDAGHTIVSFAVTMSDGERDFYIDPACYAPMNRLNGPIQEFALSTAGHNKLLTGETLKPGKTYLNYLMNESPWAPSFITKDVEEAMEKGILMDCNRSFSEIVAAAITVREATEYTGRLKMFQWAIDKGYSGNVAYIIGAMVVAYRKGEFAIAGNAGGHTALTQSMAWENIKSFFRDGYTKTKAQPSANKAFTRYEIYAGIAEVLDYHNPKQLESLGTFVAKNLKQTTIGQGFEARRVINEEALVAFCDQLQQQLTKEA